MKFFQNKAILVIVALGLLLGFSLAKNYQQKLQLEALKGEIFLNLGFDFEDKIHIDVPEPSYELEGMILPDINDHELELEAETERLKREMAKLMMEYEQMLGEHEALIEEHISISKRRRQE